MEVSIFNKKVNLLEVKEIIIGLLGIACLAGTIVGLCEGQNVLYQTRKEIWYSRSFLCLAAFIFVTARVRLLNWQSAVVSLLYWPFGYMYRVSRIDSPDLFNSDRVLVWIVWLLLMVVVDMAVYKKYTPFDKFNKYALALYVVTATFMIFFRNGRNYPVLFVVMFIFYLIPLGKEKWERVQNQFCYAWLGAYVVMLSRSVIKNNAVNADNGRWYGDFLNIGDFGLFMGCVVAVVLYKIYQVKKDKGRKNVEYILWLLILPVCIWTILKVCTITLFIGIILLLLMGFVVIRKEIKLKAVISRLIVTFVGMVVLITIVFFVLKGLKNADAYYWNKVLIEGDVIMKPIANFVCRAIYMFRVDRTFAGCNVFEPNTLISSIDLFTSGRLSIIKVFSEHFNCSGNPSGGFMVGTYFAHNTHNSYSQFIFDYGYIAGGLFIFLLLFVTVMAAYQYIKKQESSKVLVCLWMAMLLGVAMGESIFLYYPIMALSFVVFYPILVKLENKTETML